jgi:hypothetical protein
MYNKLTFSYCYFIETAGKSTMGASKMGGSRMGGKASASKNKV